MTRVTIFQSGDELRGYTCEGHARFAEHGKDIVCAAASILAVNTFNAIEALTPDKPEFQVDEKKPLISCIYRKSPSPEAALLLKAFELGVNTIMKEYGKKFLRVDYAEEC